MSNHSSTLAWKIPWTQEPGRIYSPWGRKELGTTEQLHFHFHFSFNICGCTWSLVQYLLESQENILICQIRENLKGTSPKNLELENKISEDIKFTRIIMFGEYYWFSIERRVITKKGREGRDLCSFLLKEVFFSQVKVVDVSAAECSVSSEIGKWFV